MHVVCMQYVTMKAKVKAKAPMLRRHKTMEHNVWGGCWSAPLWTKLDSVPGLTYQNDTKGIFN